MERINHLAVFVAAIVFFLFGFVWYTLLFGKLWAQLSGVPAGSMTPNIAVLIGTFVIGWFIAYICAIALGKAADNTAKDGLQFGLFMSIGLVASTMLIGALNSAQPLALWAINAGYVVVGITIISAIVAAWRSRTPA